MIRLNHPETAKHQQFKNPSGIDYQADLKQKGAHSGAEAYMHLVRAGQAANATAGAGGSQSQRNQSAPRSSRATDQPQRSGAGATGYSYDFAQRDGNRGPRPTEHA